MAKRTYRDIRYLGGASIENLRLLNNNTFPSSPYEGQFHYRPIDKTTYVYSGLGWSNLNSKAYVMPEWFGAKGDGVTDDTTALTYALTNYNNVLLSQTYKTTSLVSINTTNRKINLFGTIDSKIVGTGFYKVLEFTGNKTGSVVIRSIGIESTAGTAYDTGNFGYGIYAINQKYVNVNLCRLANIYGTGISLRSIANNISVCENELLNCSGLKYTVTPVSGLYDYYGDGIYVDDTTKGFIKNNRVLNNPTAFYGRGGIVGELDCCNLIIESNQIEGYSRNIHIEANTGYYQIVGNRCTKSTCALIYSNSSNSCIKHNYFSNEGATNVPGIANNYLVNNFGNCKNLDYHKNVIKVVTTEAKVSEYAFYANGSTNFNLRQNDIQGNFYIYNTTDFIVKKNKIKATTFTHTTCNAQIIGNELEVDTFAEGATSCKFIKNSIKGIANGVSTIIGYNSTDFSLIDNTIENPRAAIVRNDPTTVAGEISGNTINITNETISTANPWAIYTPYFTRSLIYTRKKNRKMLNGVFQEWAIYEGVKFSMEIPTAYFPVFAGTGTQVINTTAETNSVSIPIPPNFLNVYRPLKLKFFGTLNGYAEVFIRSIFGANLMSENVESFLGTNVSFHGELMLIAVNNTTVRGGFVLQSYTSLSTYTGFSIVSTIPDFTVTDLSTNAQDLKISFALDTASTSVWIQIDSWVIG